MRYALLPGMDGTEHAVRPFVEAAPEPLDVIPYPPDRALTLDEYAEHAHGLLPREPVVLIAESFGGAIAVRVAARAPNVASLVLCNAFLTPALPRPLAVLPLGILARIQAPEWVLGRWMLGSYANRERLAALRKAIGAVDAKVLASRMRICLMLDERETLARTRVPLFDVRGKHDRLVAPGKHRKDVLAARPDAQTRDIEAPHVMLLTVAGQVWATMPGDVRPRRHPQP